jgi:polysaccharide export outer membrane protein
MRPIAKHFLPVLFVTLLAVLTGCETLSDGPAPNSPQAHAGGFSDTLQVGDSVTVIFSDLSTPLQPFEERVKTDGSITLLQNQKFQAAGKNRGDLEVEIRNRYVPDYYKNLTVTIKPLERFFYVSGEVNTRSRQPYLSDITVTKAIASAGGFTDYANKKKVRLTRANGKTVTINCVKALENAALDLPVYPGDSITVPRSL